jgi:DNA-binding PadR family transcriptional regulator
MHLADMSRLSPTARVILGLIWFAPRTGYDIKQVTDRSTRFFWGASYGQIYPELRRLEAAGLVESREEPRGQVPRHVYRLTEDGRLAFESWLLEPDVQYEVRDEGLLKLFFGEAMPGERLEELVRRRRDWYRGAAALFRQIGEGIGPIEAKDPSGHVLRYGIELMEWNAEWWEQLERELS